MLSVCNASPCSQQWVADVLDPPHQNHSNFPGGPSTPKSACSMPHLCGSHGTPVHASMVVHGQQSWDGKTASSLHSQHLSPLTSTAALRCCFAVCRLTVARRRTLLRRTS